MTILFRNETVKHQFCAEFKKKWKYPEQVKKKLEAAENFIRNANSFCDISSYTPFKLERLQGVRKKRVEHQAWKYRISCYDDSV